MTQSQKSLMTVIKKTIDNEKLLPDDILSELSANDIMAEAYIQYSLHLIFEKLTKELKCDCIFDLYKNTEKLSMLHEATLSVQFGILIDAFEKYEIDIVVLKGMRIKDFYPKESLREMNDIDLLYNPSQSKKVNKILSSLGFEEYEQSTHHTVYKNKYDETFLEMHQILGYEESFESEYINAAIERKVKYEGKNHIYHLSDTDCYVYSFLHLWHHLKNGNWTFKFIVDIYAMSRRANVSFSDVEEFGKMLGINSFIKKTQAVVKYLFENEVPAKEIEELAEYYLGNSKFSKTQSYVNKLAYCSDNKFNYLIRSVFPKSSVIYMYYPFIAKHKIFLPIGYIERLVKIAFSPKGRLKSQLEILKGINSKSANDGKCFSDFLDRINS